MQGVFSDYTLRTDNQAVSWLRTNFNTIRFPARWLDQIDSEEIRFDVENVPGRLDPADPPTRSSFPQGTADGLRPGRAPLQRLALRGRPLLQRS